MPPAAVRLATLLILALAIGGCTPASAERLDVSLVDASRPAPGQVGRAVEAVVGTLGHCAKARSTDAAVEWQCAWSEPSMLHRATILATGDGAIFSWHDDMTGQSHASDKSFTEAQWAAAVRTETLALAPILSSSADPTELARVLGKAEHWPSNSFAERTLDGMRWYAQAHDPNGGITAPQWPILSVKSVGGVLPAAPNAGPDLGSTADDLGRWCASHGGKSSPPQGSSPRADCYLDDATVSTYGKAPSAWELTWLDTVPGSLAAMDLLAPGLVAKATAWASQAKEADLTVIDGVLVAVSRPRTGRTSQYILTIGLKVS